MADFKLCISDPKTTKSYQKEVKDDQAQPFVGLKIDDTIKGDIFGASGFEFKITGGSDYCGFPMRHGILGIRKRISVYGGVGFKGKGRKKKRMKGMKKRKTICGHKINEKINQINLVVIKEGAKKLAESLGAEEKPKEAPKAEAKETPKPVEKKQEKPKEAPKEEKPEKPKQAPKEEKKEATKEKPEEKPKEAPKEAEKK